MSNFLYINPLADLTSKMLQLSGLGLVLGWCVVMALP